MQKRWWLLAAVVMSAAVAHVADAQELVSNLAWAPSSATARDPGTWQLGADSTLVICRTQFSQSYTNAPITTFGACATEVYACTVERTVGAGEGCPPGSFSGERFIPKAQIATAAPPPPPPPPPPVVSRITLFGIAPHVVTTGQPVVATWTTEGMESCAVSWASTVPINGTAGFVPVATGMHSLSCRGLDTLSYSADVQLVVQEPQVFVPPPPPPCWPLPGTGVTLYETQTVDGHTVKVWGCDTPAGFVWRPVGFDPSRLAERLACVPGSIYAALTGDSLSQAWSACVDRPLSPTEVVVANALTQRWKPRFAVQGGTTVVRRPVYTRNADGTRGVQLRINNVLQYVVPGIACDGKARLLGISTRYHLVAGAVSQQGETLPADSFAQCVKNNPPTDGWP